ncbi:ABC-three component system protein [Ruegeria atlantica]|uniref:ABC-three component system protein n=1 Tax=Ruegeria atlantica TaxID=81569 RepID=UPI00147FC391|nr:ABC-three component system protein [Ruegeria atlantica]
MDPVSTAFYAQHFKIAFLEKKGTEFQDWVAKLGSHALGADFEIVRPYGKQGDWKCDGRQLSTGTIFQCYGPEMPTDQKTIAKVNVDFAGAQIKWPDFMQRWVFVHNIPGGQPPAVVSHLDTLRAENPGISFELWSESELFDWHVILDDSRALLMYGAVPNQQIASGIELADLQPVIDVLQRRDPDPAEPLPAPPSAKKLEKNELSVEAADLLRLGRRKVRLVETYFEKAGPVEIGEKIAEAFRDHYAKLKAMQLDADQMFSYLQKFAGVSGEPKRQAAAMAVMAYFFDSCDIFEDPETEVTGS